MSALEKHISDLEYVMIERDHKVKIPTEIIFRKRKYTVTRSVRGYRLVGPNQRCGRAAPYLIGYIKGQYRSPFMIKAR